MISNEKDLYEFLKSYGAWESAPKSIYEECLPLTVDECTELMNLDTTEDFTSSPEYCLYARKKKVYVIDWTEKRFGKYPEEWQEKLLELLSKRLYND